MNTHITRVSTLLLLLMVSFAACTDSGNDGPAPTEAITVTDLTANFNTVFEPASPDSNIQGNTENSPGFTFYDLDAGTVVDDSLSAAWDIAFGETTILANSGNGGGIQVVSGSYNETTEAATSGYADQTANGSWYTYTGEASSGPKHAVLPKEDQTILVLTPDNKYAKVQILSYYQGAPATDTPEFESLMTRPAGKYFTFNYTLQNDGSTKLFHEEAYTLYDLDAGEIVEDSLSSQWDIGFNATNIIANNGNGGGILSLNIDFGNVDEAPVDGYQEMNTSWYTYTGEAPNGPRHAILPNDGQTLIIRTPDERYAKIRIISYYEGNPDTGSELFANFFTRPNDRHYTFEYAIQTDGSRFFE